jgi:transcriptional regulator with PAS, ATPase and Fis domain
MQYFDKVPFAVTISDKEGKIVEMNDKSVKTFIKDGKSLIGQSLFDCHPEPARSKLSELYKNHEVNCYTIEKNGIKKLIYQSPWFENEEFMGYVELSMELSADMPHFIRK